jgi:fatty acid desaturase
MAEVVIAGSNHEKAASRPVLYTGATRRRLDPDLLVPARVRGYCQVVGNIGALVVLLVLGGRATAVWQLVLLYVGIGFALHRLFFPLHDCIHYSLFPTKTENRAMGALLSALLGTSFDAIRDQHMAHHRDFATPEDPGAADYYVRFQSRGQFLRFLLGPLVGSILVKKIGDYVSRPARAVDAAEPDRPVAAKRPKMAGRAIGYLVILAVQAGVCALLTAGFQVSRLWRYPVLNVLPAVTIFLFLVRMRMFLEHGPLDDRICNYFENKRPTARTIYANWIERVLLCGSDFNFHHEHHLYPVVPGWQLHRLHRQLMGAGLDTEDVRSSYRVAMAEIWRNLGPSARDVRKRAAGGVGGGSRRGDLPALTDAVRAPDAARRPQPGPLQS